MTLPPSIRINAQFPFPALVQGSGPIAIGKQSGIWTVSLSIANLVPLAAGSDPTTNEVLVWNTILNSWQQTTIATLLASSLKTRVQTAAGAIPVNPNDRVILVNQTVPAAANITLPTAASRGGVPITVKDFAGVAAANPLTFVPNGAETIDGAASAIINDNFEAMTLNPIATGGWWIG